MDTKSLTNILIEAITHKGLSIVYIYSPCVTFPLLDSKGLKEMLQPLPEDHHREDKLKAMEMAYSEKPVYTGIFYQVKKPTLEDRLQSVIKQVCVKDNGGEKFSLQQVLNSFA